MERIRIKSNNLRSVGYDESMRILEIEFDHGGIYQYFGVPKKIYDDLMKSESSYGQFHTRYIKNRYRHEKIP
ncbi:MAG: KTSC domain-containing protein [Nitrosopumilaceae archaeon]